VERREGIIVYYKQKIILEKLMEKKTHKIEFSKLPKGVKSLTLDTLTTKLWKTCGEQDHKLDCYVTYALLTTKYTLRQAPLKVPAINTKIIYLKSIHSMVIFLILFKTSHFN